MGPFVVVVDDGLDARKAALNALTTLVARHTTYFASETTMSELATHLIAALKDHYDIIALVQMQLQTLAHHPATQAYLMERLDVLAPSFKATLDKPLPKNYVKQEFEANQELCRSVIGCMVKLHRVLMTSQDGLAGTEKHKAAAFESLVREIRAGPKAEIWMEMTRE